MRARRAGFSLLELLVVIAILAALTGLVLPAMHEWIARARLDEVERQLPGVFATVRADARRDGVARRVVASRSADGVCIITAELIEARPVAGRGAPAGSSSDAVPARRGVRVMELPPGCEVRAAADPEGEPAKGEPGSDGGPVTVVVYLADGGAVAATGTVLRGPGGREAALRFDRVTGRLHVGGMGAPAREAAPAGDGAAPEPAGEGAP
ncbi:MAG: prepilin-type N-terminal cleavage/methylation domain-containing protein [Phycisphaerales bacterium]|nr:prepilin-type N-terminal cleavage/methylation domain-containing protein [Phycisphaerales bacterium]